MSRHRLRITKLMVSAALLAPVVQVTGCFPNGFGRDLVGSTVIGVVGDALFTLLDYVLPRA